MSDRINHECGIALVRLLKPLEYYLAKYGTATYGMNKLHLLMQKQHNRGQDGAGIASIKFNLVVNWRRVINFKVYRILLWFNSIYLICYKIFGYGKC